MQINLLDTFLGQTILGSFEVNKLGMLYSRSLVVFFRELGDAENLGNAKLDDLQLHLWMHETNKLVVVAVAAGIVVEVVDVVIAVFGD